MRLASIRGYFKNRILAQGQGGREVLTGGILEYFEYRNRAPNAEIGPKDIFEIASKFWRLLAIVLLLAGTANGALGAGSEEDRARLKQQIAGHATLHIRFWGMDWTGLPLAERVHPAPEKVIEKILLENRLYGFKERPEPVSPSPEITNALDTILMHMPNTIQRILEDRVIGVFTVNHLGGTGYSEVVYNADKHERYGIIVVDAAVLKQKRANEWATWKIDSMFRPESGRSVKVRAILEEEQDNTVVNSIRFILLHEIGHILGMATAVHPSWLVWQGGRRVDLSAGYVRLSWKNGAGKTIVSRFDDRFPQRAAIKAYAFGKAQLKASQIPLVYANLEKHTNFHTLYACESPWEDWAESFATYFHVVIDQRPWQVVIEQAGRTTSSFPAGAKPAAGIRKHSCSNGSKNQASGVWNPGSDRLSDSGLLTPDSRLSLQPLSSSSVTTSRWMAM